MRQQDLSKKGGLNKLPNTGFTHSKRRWVNIRFLHSMWGGERKSNRALNIIVRKARNGK